MRFKVKPFVVEAEQWWPDKPGSSSSLVKLEHGVGILRTTDGNTYTLNPGDWIVTNAAGVKQGYTQRNFEAVYDPLGPEDLTKVLAGLVGSWHKKNAGLPAEIEIGEYVLSAVGLESLKIYHTEFGASIPVRIIKGDKINLKESIDAQVVA